jgi:hypothetical protein
VLRRPNGGRSAARNAGAAAAAAPVLVFLDDDMEVGRDFVSRHAHLHDGSDRLISGDVALPRSFAGRRFGRFRLWLEALHRPAVPTGSELVEVDGFTAANMSAPRRLFLELGGFDARLTLPGCEDYELYLRARAKGIPCWFAPGITAVHHDGFAGIRSYAARELRHAEGWVQLMRLRPEIATEVPRFRSFRLHNDPRVAAGESRRRQAATALKSLLARGRAGAVMIGLARLLERLPVPDGVLRVLYMRALSFETARGYARAIRTEPPPSPPNVPSGRVHEEASLP